MKTTEYSPFVSVLTGTGTIVLVALLRVTFQSTVKTMLPELWKPGVPVVVFRTKFKVVVIKPFHVGRLELDGDTPCRFLDKTICDIIPVGPSITAEEHVREACKCLAGLNSHHVLHIQNAMIQSYLL